MINTEKRGRIEIVSLTESKLNALTAETFREEVTLLFSENNSRVIINLTGVDYIDSTGFGALLSLLRVAKNNYGMLKLCSPEEPVKKIFSTLHLDSIFEIYSNLDECLKSFS
ncbi:MAG: STAS domain-containing protein [Bacteroidales bacterium]|nr:STAS domain-containing protein [Bacteroidales bacterium]